jgi:hypothetical protein
MDRRALIEVLEPDGRVVQTAAVLQWPFTVGRALDCDLVLNDPHVAAHHLTLDEVPENPGRVQITVGETRNGVRLGGHRPARRLAGGTRTVLAPGATCLIGRQLLRVRLASEALTPETPDLPERWPRGLLALGAVALLGLWIGFGQWLRLEPGSGWDKYLPTLLSIGTAVAAWSAFWGLGSKLFQRHFRFLPHLQLLLAFVLAGIALDLVLAAAAYALSLPLLSHLRAWVNIALFCALLATHVTLLVPGHQRAVRRSFALLCVAVLGINGALNWRHHQRVFDELTLASLPPPQLRLVPARPIGTLLDDLRSTRAPLERRAHDDEDNDAQDD